MEPDVIAALARAGRRRAIFDPCAEDRVNLTRPDLERLLPHREPFLFVDAIAAANLEAGTILGRRHIDPKDPLFAGHFPGAPIYPGVLQLEIMGQVGLCLLSLRRNGRLSVGPGDRAADIRALKIHHAAFFEAVAPGDELEIRAKVLEANDYTGICEGQLLRANTICSHAITEVYFVDG